MNTDSPDLKKAMLERIRADAPRKVWTPSDFVDLASRDAVDKALQRLTKVEILRRIDRGLYDQPGFNKLTQKPNPPDPRSVIDAVGRRDQTRMLVDGMTAANDLGLTTAVPARSTIYADTYPRTIEIEASAGDPKVTKPVIYTLDFKRIAAKTAFWAGRPAMRVVQALAWFRDEKSSLDAAVNGIVRHLARDPGRVRVVDDLRENIHAVPAWMYPLIETITGRLTEDHSESAPGTERTKSEHAEDIH